MTIKPIKISGPQDEKSAGNRQKLVLNPLTMISFGFFSVIFVLIVINIFKPTVIIIGINELINTSTLPIN